MLQKTWEMDREVDFTKNKFRVQVECKKSVVDKLIWRYNSRGHQHLKLQNFVLQTNIYYGHAVRIN